MFLDQSYEKIFYETLAAYEGEFGADRIIVIIPENYRHMYEPSMFAPMELRTWDLPQVGIKVEGASAHFELIVT